MRVTRPLILLYVLAVGSQSLRTQTSDSQSKNVQEWHNYSAKLEEFKKLGRRAYADEQAREKKGDCPKAMTTYDINMCLAKEVDVITANYKAYTSALRSAEALSSTGESDAVGPTGKPLTPAQRSQNFDTVESAWRTFYEAQCSAAFDAYRGGTIAPSVQLNCRLQLIRDRMHELESIYQFMH